MNVQLERILKKLRRKLGARCDNHTATRWLDYRAPDKSTPDSIIYSGRIS